MLNLLIEWIFHSEIIELLKKINDFGTTILVTTHNETIVNNLGKRVITLKDGLVVSDQKTHGIYRLDGESETVFDRTVPKAPGFNLSARDFSSPVHPADADALKASAPEPPAAPQKPEKPKKPAKTGISVNYAEEAQKELSSKLGRACRIVTGRKKGRIELEYYGLDDLNDLLDALSALKQRK